VQVTEAVELGPGLLDGGTEHRTAAVAPFPVEIECVARRRDQGRTMRHDDINTLRNRMLRPGAKTILFWAIRKCVAVELGRVWRRINCKGPPVPQGEFLSAFFQEVEAVYLFCDEQREGLCWLFGVVFLFDQVLLPPLRVEGNILSAKLAMSYFSKASSGGTHVVTGND